MLVYSGPRDDGRRSRRLSHGPRLLVAIICAAACACVDASSGTAARTPAGADSAASTTRIRRPEHGTHMHGAASTSTHSSTPISVRRGEQLPQELRSTEAGTADAWAHMHGDTAVDPDIFQTVDPFIVEDAEVEGPLSDEEQATLEAEYGEEMEDVGGEEEGVSEGAARTLLHGKRKPSRYPKCNRCMVVRCAGSKCTGHCKKKSRLFFCTGRGEVRTCQRGGTPWFTQPETIPADRLEPASSVIVTANVPYIGCANITGMPSGCPGPDTPGAVSRRFTLLGSTCVNRNHALQDCESPEFPFGYCMCQYEFNLSRGRKRIRDIPCSSVGMGLDLELARAAVEDGEEGPGPLLSDLRVRVERDGEDTITTFHDYAEVEDGATWSYNQTFLLIDRPDVKVKLDYYYTWYSQGNNFTTSGSVLPEYEDDPETLAYDELVEDYYFRSPPRYYMESPFALCLLNCRLSGGQVLGSVDADYYSVYYTGGPSCDHCDDIYTYGSYDDTAIGEFDASRFNVTML